MTSSAIDSIDPAQLASWLQQARQSTPGARLPVVLDVRQDWELQTAAVQPQGFELLHMPMHSVPERHTELSPQHPIACLCHHGTRSAQVTRFLLSQGFTHVVNIRGGIHAWAQTVDSSVPIY